MNEQELPLEEQIEFEIMHKADGQIMKGIGNAVLFVAELLLKSGVRLELLGPELDFQTLIAFTIQIERKYGLSIDQHALQDVYLFSVTEMKNYAIQATDLDPAHVRILREIGRALAHDPRERHDGQGLAPSSRADLRTGKGR